jgi:uncharacterized protein YqeY
MPPESPGSLKARLKNDVNTALRAGERARLSVLRMAMAAIQQREVDGRLTLADDGIQAVLEKMVKQRNEAIEQFRSGGREDLAAKESAEIEVLKEYLPEPMDPEEAERLVEDVIHSLGASSPKDMGRVMAELKSRAAGRVDLAELSKRVRTRLSAA